MKNRKKRIADITNRIFYIQGIDCDGYETERWCIVSKKLYKTILTQEKKLDKTIQTQAKLGDLVVHKIHPLGLGLVAAKHPKLNAYRVQWVNHENLDLFIDAKILIPINKEHAHESDGL